MNWEDVKMKKVLTLVSMASILLASTAASSQSFSPTSADWEFGDGVQELDLFQTIPGVACVTIFDFSVDGSGFGSITGNIGSFSPGHFACGAPVIPGNFSWPLTVNSHTPGVTANVNINNVYVFAVNGFCQGSINNVTLDLVNQKVIIPPATKVYGELFSNPGVQYDCEVGGELDIIPVGHSSPLS